MAEDFLQLSVTDRRDALGVASAAIGRPAHLLEKDVWVVWALQALFESPFGPDLVFKGGTSLSKAYGVIDRFSEDIDLTYSIRAIAPDLVKNGVLPPTTNQGRKWTRRIQDLLESWVERAALEVIASALRAGNLPASCRAERASIFIEYEALAAGTGYVAPRVILELGARSTGEPHSRRLVTCDVAAELSGLLFPRAEPNVMHAERTFWEKATAIHVFCLCGEFRGANRFARHWYDVSCLFKKGYAERALSDADLAADVAKHKSIFFREKDSSGNWIDYMDAVSGALRLAPSGEPLARLKDDYEAMAADGLLHAPEAFSEILARCQEVEALANSR